MTAPLSLGQSLDKNNVILFGSFPYINIKQICDCVNDFFGKNSLYQEGKQDNYRGQVIPRDINMPVSQTCVKQTAIFSTDKKIDFR